MVPLDSEGRINEAELARYIEWLIQKGVHGLYPNGSTGEFTRFSADERKRIVKIVCEVSNGRVPILAGAAEANIRETLIACERYAEYGARAVAVISPIFYKLGQESIFAYFKEIAEQSVIDVTVYNIPMLSTPIDLNTIERLSAYERIIGIKDSSGDVGLMTQMISRIRPQRPEFAFMTGWEAVLVPMLAAGADGGTNASSGVVPEVTRRLFDLFHEGDLKESMTIQYRLTDLFERLLRGADFPEGFRTGVEIRGFEMGSSRQPLSGDQQIDRSELKRMLHCLIADFDLVDRPQYCESSSKLPTSSDRAAKEIARQVAKELSITSDPE